MAHQQKESLQSKQPARALLVSTFITMHFVPGLEFWQLRLSYAVASVHSDIAYAGLQTCRLGQRTIFCGRAEQACSTASSCCPSKD
jgi:hypothetical protein